MEKYFVIHNGEGDTTVTEFTKEELLEAVEDGYWGNDMDYLKAIPKDNDTNYWGASCLIIKGSIVIPKAEQVITKHIID